MALTPPCSPHVAGASRPCRRSQPAALAALAFLLSPAAILPAQTTAPSTRSTTQSNPASKETAATWYKAEFGPTLTPADITRLYTAHQLIESYFAGNREAALKRLNELAIKPAEVARLSRMRLTWPDWKPGIHRVTEKDTDFLVSIPEGYRRESPLPTMLLLGHGDEDKFVREQTSKWPGFLLIAPVWKPIQQGGGLWGPGREGMNAVINSLQRAADLFAIDPRRVFLRGMEDTGPAAFDIALHYPTYFAGVSAEGSMPYDWQRLRAGNLRNISTVVAQDGQPHDKPRTRDWVTALRQQKVPLLREEKTWTTAIRELDPNSLILRTSRPDVPFNRNDWIQAWQPASPGREETRVVRGGGAGVRVYTIPISIEASYARNKITLTTKNTAGLRVLLSDDMVDFSRAISIEMNHKVLFEGFITPGIEATLRDQLLLGRGWRQYTAAIDLEGGLSATQPTPSPRPTP